MLINEFEGLSLWNVKTLKLNQLSAEVILSKLSFGKMFKTVGDVEFSEDVGDDLETAGD